MADLKEAEKLILEKILDILDKMRMRASQLTSPGKQSQLSILVFILISIVDLSSSISGFFPAASQSRLPKKKKQNSRAKRIRLQCLSPGDLSHEEEIRHPKPHRTFPLTLIHLQKTK